MQFTLFLCLILKLYKLLLITFFFEALLLTCCHHGWETGGSHPVVSSLFSKDVKFPRVSNTSNMSRIRFWIMKCKRRCLAAINTCAAADVFLVCVEEGS